MLAILLASSLFFCGTQAQLGEDMSDEDFASFIQAHDNFRERYAKAAAVGCVGGAIKDGLKGGSVPALCIGCTTGAAAAVGIQMTFPQMPKRERE